MVFSQRKNINKQRIEKSIIEPRRCIERKNIYMFNYYNFIICKNKLTTQQVLNFSALP